MTSWTKGVIPLSCHRNSYTRWVLWQSTGPFTFAHSFLICIDICQLPFTHGDRLQFVTDVPWHCAHNGLRHLTYIALMRCDCNDPIDFGWHTGSVQSVKVIVLIATVFFQMLCFHFGVNALNRDRFLQILYVTIIWTYVMRFIIEDVLDGDKRNLH